ncbi:MAG: response regulator [Thermodesulfobacteriota bacterium]|nr:response regulator [Thermodesulfobacteriota bacterium]
MAKILIAEDDRITCLVLAKILEDMGHVAILCRDGRRAMDTLADNQDIAVVITDVSMPEMDGRELIQNIRSNKETALLPVIMISGVVGPKEIADVLSLGAAAFLPKPINPTDLSLCVERYLG